MDADQGRRDRSAAPRRDQARRSRRDADLRPSPRPAGLIGAEYAAQVGADLAERHAALDALEDARHQVVRAARGFDEVRPRGRGALRVAPRAQCPESMPLALGDALVHAQERRRRAIVGAERVHSDDDTLSGLDLPLIAICAVLDLALLVPA